MDQNNKNNEGIDLSGALKGSGGGAKSREQGVERTFFPGTPKVIQWTIKYSWGLIQNKKQASYVLLGFAALAIVISLFLIFGGGKESEIKAPPGQRIIYPENEPPRLQERF